jgi:pyruvate/2-oxoglutarate dehydrogenase complex dihydrolipoamide acyltransferase (E2) component
LPRIKKISGANLHRNWVVIPHVTTHDEADITDLEQFRVQMNKELEKSGVKISMLPFMMKAAVRALKKFPEFNASLDGDALVLKNYWHIGFAADTPNGLMVPVIRDVDRKTVPEIAKEMGELAKLARDGKLKPDQMQGGTFTISLNVGCIPSKALLHTASVMDEVKSLGRHGIKYARPEVDVDALRGFKDGVVKKLTGGLAGMAKARKVEVVTGVGSFLDPHHLEVVGAAARRRSSSSRRPSSRRARRP